MEKNNIGRLYNINKINHPIPSSKRLNTFNQIVPGLPLVSIK